MSPLSRYVVETLVTLLAVVALCVLLLSLLRRGAWAKRAAHSSCWRLPWKARAVYLCALAKRLRAGASESSLAKLGEMPRSTLPESQPRTGTFNAVLKRALECTRQPLRQPWTPARYIEGAVVTAAPIVRRPITLIVALGIAKLLPFAFMTLTAFVKISTVLRSCAERSARRTCRPAP